MIPCVAQRGTALSRRTRREDTQDCKLGSSLSALLVARVTEESIAQKCQATIPASPTAAYKRTRRLPSAADTMIGSIGFNVFVGVLESISAAMLVGKLVGSLADEDDAIRTQVSSGAGPAIQSSQSFSHTRILYMAATS